MSRIDKAIETGSRLAVTYGCGVRGRNEERPLMRMGFLSGWRKCPESGCSDVCITVTIVKIIELHILNGWIICYIHYILIKFSPKNVCKIFASTSSGINRQHTPYGEKKLSKSSYCNRGEEFAIFYHLPFNSSKAFVCAVQVDFWITERVEKISLFGQVLWDQSLLKKLEPQTTSLFT